MMKAISPSILQKLNTYLIVSYATDFPTLLKKNQFGRKKKNWSWTVVVKAVKGFIQKLLQWGKRGLNIELGPIPRTARNGDL